MLLSSHFMQLNVTFYHTTVKTIVDALQIAFKSFICEYINNEGIGHVILSFKHSTKYHNSFEFKFITILLPTVISHLTFATNTSEMKMKSPSSSR